MQVVQVEGEDGKIREYRTKEEMHKAIWSNIHRKRLFLAETAPIYSAPLRQQFGYNAAMEAADQVLAETFDTNENTNAATKEIFQELRQIRKTILPDSEQEIIRTAD